MTPALLTRYGEAIYGPLWQCALARDLGIADRTVRRWIAGEFNIPDTVETDLARKVDQRIVELKKLQLKKPGGLK